MSKLYFMKSFYAPSFRYQKNDRSKDTSSILVFTHINDFIGTPTQINF